MCQLHQRAHAIVRVRLLLGLSKRLCELSVMCIPQLLVDRLRVDLRVPDVHLADRGEPAHRLAIGAHDFEHGRSALLGGEVAIPRGDFEARRQALDVPLERSGKRFVEVVEVENEIALRRCKAAEVQKVGIARKLNRQSGGRRRHEIAGHHRSRAAEERER